MAKRLSWAVRIANAEKRGRFLDSEIDFARDSWSTCAVGEKHNWPTPRKYYGPDSTQNEEFKLGAAFGNAVYSQDIPEAKRLYEAIMAL